MSKRWAIGDGGTVLVRDGVTGVREPVDERTAVLLGNAPNPFGASTAIRYVLQSGTTSNVKLTVHDAAGRIVRTLVDGELAGGVHTTRWDGRDASGARAAGGVYFYRLQTNERAESGRMVLLH